MKLLNRYLSFTITVLACAQLQAQGVTPQVTYNGEAGRIINENCVVCHRVGGIGPMQLESYAQVRPWAPLIQLKVANREMPPYAYDHGIGIQELQGDWRLQQEEIDTLVAWVNQGAPLGDSELVLPPAELNDPTAWNFVSELGEPDLVIASIPMDIPATGNDIWSSHYVPSGITSARCIKAIQVKPRGDAKSVVHHANSSIEVFNEEGELERHSQLTEYAMGKWGELVPADVCRTIPADSVVRWGIHMFPGGLGSIAPGTIIEDNVVEIGIWLHPEGYENEVQYTQDLKQYHIQFERSKRAVELVIPPNGHLMTQGFHSFDHPVRIDSFQPHGHLRLVAASLEIFYPESGRLEPISQISNWSATWHHSHIYAADVAPLLPTGAVLVLKQWYDNTAANPNNPDPNVWVSGGDRTADEMSHAWLAVTHLDDAGFEKLLAERKARDAASIAGND
ncbi:MAG: hypothetical protein IIC60_15080 [Proteobacteria bacterium]|nr:hypothetical protein [Pseudomonadota bacterium]